MISAVVLAAGLSNRMGRPKQLLKLGDKTILEHVVGQVLKSKVSETIVILGAYQEEIKQVLSGYEVKCIKNPQYKDGQGTSVAAGAAAVNPEARGILFLVADQPLISPEAINRMIEVFTQTGALIVRPEETGNPVLFDTSLRDSLTRLTGDAGGRQVIEKYKNQVVKILDCPGLITLDVDTEEDYKIMKDLWDKHQPTSPVR